METYYVINEETLEVMKIGKYPSWQEAQDEVHSNEDHYSHNQECIVVPEEHLTTLVQNMMRHLYSGI